MSETGRKLGLDVSSTVVAMFTEEDRLKCDAKLERLDFELSVRTGEFLASGEVAGG